MKISKKNQMILPLQFTIHFGVGSSMNRNKEPMGNEPEMISWNYILER